MSMSMTEEEVETFLKENKMLRLASIGADGTPGVVPLAFMYDDGRFYISTEAKSRKVRNIRANNKVAFCVDTSENPAKLAAVVGKGTVSILTPGTVYDKTLKKLIIHLVGNFEHPFAKRMMQSDRILLEIVPTSTKSWKIPTP